MKEVGMKKKWVVGIMTIVTIIGLALVSIHFKTASYNSILSKYKFDFKQSVPVKTALNLSDIQNEKLKDILVHNKKKAIIFGSRECGNCMELAPAIPSLVKQFPRIQWIYVEKSPEKPISIHFPFEFLFTQRGNKT